MANPKQPDITMPQGGTKYVALMLQESTNAPVATILQNTIGNIIWTYDSTGYYVGTLTGAFKSKKCLATIGNAGAYNDSAGQFVAVYAWFNNSDEDHIFMASEYTGTLSDGQITYAPLQITIYP